MAQDYCVSRMVMPDPFTKEMVSMYAIYPMKVVEGGSVPDISSVRGYMVNMKDAEDVILTLYHGRLV